jgi:hypothetical protein
VAGPGLLGLTGATRAHQSLLWSAKDSAYKGRLISRYQLMNSTCAPPPDEPSESEKPLEDYQIEQQNQWDKRKWRYGSLIRDIVDTYFHLKLDLVKCWEELEKFIPIRWRDDWMLCELHHILVVCTIKGERLEKPRWFYSVIRRIQWNRLSKLIDDPEIRIIVDWYFDEDFDPVHCWEEVLTRIPTCWRDDSVFSKLYRILDDCNIQGRSLD